MPEEVRADLLLGRDTLSPGLVKAGEAASKASDNVSQLTRDLYELSRQRATPVVDLNDADATAKLTDVTAKLDELGKKVADARVAVDDKDAQAQLAEFQVKLNTLGQKVSKPRITLDGLARAEAGILRLDAQLDAFGRKHETATVSVDKKGGLLSRLGGLLGSGGPGGGAGGLFGLAGAGADSSVALPWGWIAAALGGALLAPAAVPFGLGGLTAGGGVLGAFLAASSANKKLTQLQTQLASAKGPQKKDLQQQVAALKDQYGAVLGFYNAAQGIFGTGKETVLNALGAKGPGFSGGGPGGTQGAPSFLSGMIGIFKQIAGFVKSIGPQLGDLFRASLPFASAFVKVLEQFTKAVLPAMTQSLKELAPDLPILIQGFVLLAQGIAGFIRNLGPGMKDSAIIFKGAMEVVKGILQFVGVAASGLAIVFVKTFEGIRAFARGVPPFFDKMFHAIASLFDEWRHWWANAWDVVFNNTIGRIERGRHDIAHEWDLWRHDTAAIFAAVRHDIASAWDTIWNNTIGRVRTGIAAVVGFFKGLPGKVIGALFGLGHQLYAFGHAALTDFLNGLKSIGGTILSWLGSLWHSIVGIAKKVLGIFSPSKVFYDIGKNLMTGLFHGIRDHAHLASGAVGGAVGGLGPGASSVAALARRMAAAWGWADQWGAINAVEMREAGWSLTARNPSSGAYGIAQFINGPGEYYQYGGNPNTAAGQITGFYNYIRQRYGSPSAAWQHELNFGWYDKGGYLPPGLTLAYNATGRPEQVIPPSNGGGAAKVVLEVRSGGASADAFIAEMIRRYVRVRGGDVQAVFGRN